MPIMTFWAKEPFPRQDSLRYSDHQIPICTPKTPCKPWPREIHTSNEDLANAETIAVSGTPDSMTWARLVKPTGSATEP
ncbi:MAG: hypothetical protein QOG25_1651 [Acetobacteraceae bacterium]|nr:hypothetical protein [Acetobacteraceae bacterium]